MLNLNDIPTNGKVYFAGIGGISMSALAMVLKNKNYDVCGYDRTPSDITLELQKNGIEVFYETDESNLTGVKCAIYTAALNPEHPEIVQIVRKEIPLYKRAELLGAIAKEYENSIAVAGTHGKSTTSGMLSNVYMQNNSYDPTVLVGAVMPELNSTFRLGGDQNFIFEADEYKDSFLSFYPHIAIVLNIKLDHTDYFPNFKCLIKSFSGFINNIGKDGIAVINSDSVGAVKAAEGYEGKIVTFSAEGRHNADFYAQNIVINKGFATFDVYKKERFHMTVTLSIPGIHNVSNALAVIACCDFCKVDKQTVIDGIQTYRGVCRRFELKGKYKGAVVFDDYAHHPDEIKATLRAAKSMEYNRVISVFQPHTYSRLNSFLDDFAASFKESDIPVFADVYSAREKNIYGITSSSLAEKVEGGIYIESSDDFSKIEDYLRNTVKSGDLLIFMGAGNITTLAKAIVK